MAGTASIDFRGGASLFELYLKMDIHELNPGYYHIREKSDSETKHLAANVHLLRVTGHGENMMLFIDHELHGFRVNEGKHYLDNFEVSRRLSGEPHVGKCKITIEFTDAYGATFRWSVKDAWALRNVFEAMPWLKDPFGFVKRRR